ncbi:LVIVD repeat-containing protein [Nocardia sp. A7]|uniref:LVIVD repeat-containing protein n=1 Tax=Nocardia sp. A7 TaxID=2789274 RepID=UPI00397B6CB4
MTSLYTRTARRCAAVAAVTLLMPLGAASIQPATGAPTGQAVSPADCSPGSLPETGLQGDVPAVDRDSGRSRDGFRCNMRLLGSSAARGGGVTSVTYDHCAYIGSIFAGDPFGPDAGVRVLDVADPTAAVHTATLTEPAMLAGTWETLKVNAARKLLVGAGVPALTGAGLLSVYDISDCAHPRLLNPGPGTDLAQPIPITAHEGGFSPDGRTYWASGTAPGLLSAVDLTDPANPHVIWQGLAGLSMHGFGISPDGNRMYLANNTGGLKVLDISTVQRRDAEPRVLELADMPWSDGWATQHAVPVTYQGVPYVFAVDEAGSGGVKLIDVSDDRRPRLAQSIKLAINLAENQDSLIASASGGSLFAYDAHYCAADRPTDPTALACSWTSSGIRVFDVRDPAAIREIAYFNPPARIDENAELSNSLHARTSIIGPPLLAAPSVVQAILQGQFDPQQALSSRTGMLTSGDLSTDWCFSPPEWRGNQLWTTCADNGFLALELAPTVYTPPADQASITGS